MLDVAGYDYIRFDTLGDLSVTEDGYIRFDRNCTPGKTVPCGNACRKPENCKKKGTSTAPASKSGGRLAELRSKYQTKSGALNSRAKKALSRGTSAEEKDRLLDQMIESREKAGKYNNPEYASLSRKYGQAETRQEVSAAIASARKGRTAKSATKTEREAAARAASAKKKYTDLSREQRELANQSWNTRMTKGKYNPEYESLSRRLAENDNKRYAAETSIKRNRAKRRKDSFGNWIYDYDYA